MKIGPYTLIGTEGNTPLGTLDSRLYLLQPCPTGMSADRAAAVAQAMTKAILPGSNVLIPDFFESDTGWYAAAPYRETVFRGLPTDYLRVLPDKARRHMALLAVSAVECLAQGELVHGTLCPERFRMTVTPSGVLCLVLADLRSAGTRAFPALEPEEIDLYTAPEVRQGKAASTASDVFSLGMCLHMWFTGELPRSRSGTDEPLTRSTLWLSDAVPMWARSVMLSMLEADPAARPKPSDVLQRLRSASETCSDLVYASSEMPPEEQSELRKLLLQEDPRLLARYQDA